jgi:anti-sigma B factor antagonist
VRLAEGSGMLLDVEVDEDARVARLRGELDLSTKETFADALEPLVAAGGDVVVDMEDVTFVDSTGLHGLLSVAEALGPDRRLTLRRPRRTLVRLLEISGLEGRFDIVEPGMD